MNHTYTILHLFCGAGGSGLGGGAAAARVGEHEASFKTVGGIDIDPLACQDFEALTGAPAWCADVGAMQPAQLRELVPTCPDVVMSSPPCKGYSGLLSAKRAQEAKYVEMNQLMVRALMLLTSTWETAPSLIFFENVPRIESRGRDVIAQCRAVLEAAGYSVAIGNHNCGELGGLAQNRHRWFLLARHRGRCDQFVYNPPSLRVRGCGEVLERLPMPGDVAAAGAMHAVPDLHWKNWVRLALIPAGGDWRDLPGVLAEGEARRKKFRRAPVTRWEEPAEVVTGPGGSASTSVADPRLAAAVALADNPARHKNKLQVRLWDEPIDTVTTTPSVGGGAPSVADPRWGGGRLGVTGWDEPGRCVTGNTRPSANGGAVADPRPFGNVDRVTPWTEPVHCVTSKAAPASGGAAVADPRWGAGPLGVVPWNEPVGAVAGESYPSNGRNAVADPRFDEGKRKNWQQVYGVTAWDQPAPIVTGNAGLHAGAYQVADPRLTCEPRAGAYRVLSWQEAAATITGSLRIDNGAAAVADPRIPSLDPDRAPPFTPIIVAADGTWHRPLTTLELAALQGLPPTIDGAPLVLAGRSHTRWREAIGNMVPPPAAAAIGSQLLRALLASALGRFELSSLDIWVAPFEPGGDPVTC